MMAEITASRLYKTIPHVEMQSVLHNNHLFLKLALKKSNGK